MKKWVGYVVPLLILGVFLGGRYFYFKPKYINGEQAPDFSGQLLNGADFSLSDLKGHYVLLDFWGSWCGPCRKENPALVALYRDFQGSSFQDADGFEIVSIGIEQNEDAWKAAIQRDGLIWPYHISENQRFKSPTALKYGVREVPTKYLLNPRGQIIGVNLPVAEIRRMLQGRLAS